MKIPPLPPGLTDAQLKAVNQVLDAVISAEREACAKIADELANVDDDPETAAIIAVRIRARKVRA